MFCSYMPEKFWVKKISVRNISSLNNLNCAKFPKYQKNPNIFCGKLVTLVTCKHVKVKPICGKQICVQNNLQKSQSSIFIDMLTVQMSWINWSLFWNSSFLYTLYFTTLRIFAFFSQICKKIWNFSKWCNSSRNAKKKFCGLICY